MGILHFSLRNKLSYKILFLTFVVLAALFSFGIDVPKAEATHECLLGSADMRTKVGEMFCGSWYTSIPSCGGDTGDVVPSNPTECTPLTGSGCINGEPGIDATYRSIMSCTPLAHGIPEITVTPASQDFGDVVVNNSGFRSFVVENTGSGTLLGQVSGLSGRWSCSANCGQYILDAGETVTVSVQFSPTAVGVDSDTAVFSCSGCSNGSSVSRGVSGNGVLATFDLSTIEFWDVGSIRADWFRAGLRVTFPNSVSPSQTFNVNGSVWCSGDDKSGSVDIGGHLTGPIEIFPGGPRTVNCVSGIGGGSIGVLQITAPATPGIYTRDFYVTVVASSYNILEQSPQLAVKGTLSYEVVAASPPTVTLTAVPSTITAPNSTSLEWTTTGSPDSCEIGDLTSGGTTTVSASGGSRDFFPAVTTDYLIYCPKAGHTAATDQVTVTVNAAAPTLNINPASLDFGDTQVGTTKDLSFVVSNTGGGTITVDPNPVISGAFAGQYTCVSANCGFSQSVTNGAPQTYTVRYAPTSVSDGQTATLTIDGTFTQGVSLTGNGTAVPPPLPTANFTSPLAVTITAGDSTNLDYTSTNADPNSCVIEEIVGGTPTGLTWSGLPIPSGTQSVNPVVDTSYSVSCSNTTGVSPDSPDIVVTVNAPPPIYFIATTPTTITVGDSVTFEWQCPANVNGNTVTQMEMFPFPGVGSVYEPTAGWTVDTYTHVFNTTGTFTINGECWGTIPVIETQWVDSVTVTVNAVAGSCALEANKSISGGVGQVIVYADGWGGETGVQNPATWANVCKSQCNSVSASLCEMEFRQAYDPNDVIGSLNGSVTCYSYTSGSVQNEPYIPDNDPAPNRTEEITFYAADCSLSCDPGEYSIHSAQGITPWDCTVAWDTPFQNDAADWARAQGVPEADVNGMQADFTTFFGGTGPAEAVTTLSNSNASISWDLWQTQGNAGDGTECSGRITVSCPATTPPECSDSIDNDGDTFIDFPNDPGCDDPDDDDETDPPTVTLTAVPSTITAPNSTSLEWTTTGSPDSCEIGDLTSGGTTTVSASGGSRDFFPAVTTDYLIYCPKAGHTAATDQVTVTVNAVPAAINVVPASHNFGTLVAGSFDAITFTVSNTGGGTLTGDVTAPGAPFSCTSGCGVGVLSLSGAATHDVVIRYDAPGTPGPYSDVVQFTSNGGNTNRAVQGDVGVPTVTISATPEQVLKGQKVTISWTGDNVESIVVEQEVVDTATITVLDDTSHPNVGSTYFGISGDISDIQVDEPTIFRVIGETLAGPGAEQEDTVSVEVFVPIFIEE